MLFLQAFLDDSVLIFLSVESNLFDSLGVPRIVCKVRTECVKDSLQSEIFHKKN